MESLKLKWVSDTIGEEYKQWSAGDIIKIQAQTGTGKTWFIKNKLVPCLEEWENMLIIANRINLKRQLKKDLLEYYNEPIPEDLEKLDAITKIGNVMILSYQALAQIQNAYDYKMSVLDLDNYKYIVADEVHHLLTDASYNAKTDLAFQALVRTRHRQSVKIFISATLDELNEAINKSFKDIKEIGFGSYAKAQLWEYTTGIDYSYLDIKYFKNIIDIATVIKNDKSKDKWLVFVTKKTDAEKIKEVLKGNKKVSIITKDTNIKKNKDLQAIIEESKYKADVLICTKAMDNGINIADNSVKNIVIMAWDKTTFIQELGRIRLDINNPYRVNLYIQCRSWKAFNTLIETKYNKKFDLIEQYNNQDGKFKFHYNKNYTQLPQDIFYLNEKDNEWTINKMGFARLLKDSAFAKEMLKKFDIDNDFAFVHTQLEWLEQENQFNEEKLIQEVIDIEEVENLEEWLESHMDKKILEEEQQELCKILTSELLKISREKLQAKNKMHPDTVNSILKNDLKLPYTVTAIKTSKRIDGKPRRYTYWNVIKTVIQEQE